MATAKKTTKTEGLYQSLFEFQNEVPVLCKNAQGYGYKYLSFEEMVKAITPIMQKHNLGFLQPLHEDGIKTIVYHVKTGEQIESFCRIPQNVNLKGMNEFQAYGSAISYFRRYTLSSLLGLVSDKDADASGEQVKKNKPTLSEEKFKNALIAIEKGGYTATALRDTFNLTNEQLKQL